MRVEETVARRNDASGVTAVSVIIPVYRAARTIGRALRSALQQTRPPAEIIVVDDGSPDGDELSEIVASFGPPVTIVRKANGGAASARNVGIDLAQQEWVAFLDADDYWEPNKLERQFDAIARYPDVGLVGCGWFIEMPGEARVGANHCLPFSGRRLRPRGRTAFDVALILGTGCLLVRRSVLSGQRFDPTLASAEDRDLWIRLVMTTEVFILPDRLMTFVQEPGSLSRGDVDRDLECMLRVVWRYSELLGTRGCREQEAHVYRRWAAWHLAHGRAAQALPPALTRLSRQPVSLQAWWIVAKASLLAGLEALSRRGSGA